MTNGILLQRMSHDAKFLAKYPIIILDEIHERDIDSDFIMVSIKHLISRNPNVKLILMSATIDNKLFSHYFAKDHVTVFMHLPDYYLN